MIANQRAQSMFGNTEVLQAMGMLPAIGKIWAVHHDRALTLQAVASDRAGLFIASTKWFRAFLQTAILGLGACLVIDRQLSPGGMIAGSIIIWRALAPIELAVGSWKGLVAARGAFDRLRVLFTVAGVEHERMPLPRPLGAIRVSELIASVPGPNNFPILKGVTFNVEAGGQNFSPVALVARDSRKNSWRPQTPILGRTKKLG